MNLVYNQNKYYLVVVGNSQLKQSILTVHLIASLLVSVLASTHKWYRYVSSRSFRIKKGNLEVYPSKTTRS